MKEPAYQTDKWGFPTDWIEKDPAAELARRWAWERVFKTFKTGKLPIENSSMTKNQENSEIMDLF
jgi:hypothetical protein